MPTKRQSKVQIDFAVAQLLSALQLDGHLDRVVLPDWAEDTSVSELFDAIQSIGDGEWLASHYPDKGMFEAADQWIGDFMAGREVPTRDDSPDDAGGADEDDVEDSRVSAVFEYAKSLPAAKSKSFLKRLEDPDFMAMAVKNMYSASESIVQAFLLDDKEFAQAAASFTFMDPAFVADPDIAEMSIYYVVEHYQTVFDQVRALTPGSENAQKRAKEMGTKLKKAIAANREKPQ